MIRAANEHGNTAGRRACETSRQIHGSQTSRHKNGIERTKPNQTLYLTARPTTHAIMTYASGEPDLSVGHTLERPPFVPLVSHARRARRVRGGTVALLRVPPGIALRARAFAPGGLTLCSCSSPNGPCRPSPPLRSEGRLPRVRPAAAAVPFVRRARRPPRRRRRARTRSHRRRGSPRAA